MTAPDEFQEFHDPRLVALYDYDAASRRDVPFWISLAAELGARSIVDIGCGTGFITVELARRGHVVTGVDPAGAMLEVARSRPDGDLVRWIEGDASALDGEPPADLAIMTAHVAQVIHDEDAWRAALAGAYRALRPGGYLAFESRNPEARGWERWTREATEQRLVDTPVGTVDAWWQLTDVRDDLVWSEIHYVFESDGAHVVSSNVLRFRSRAALEQSLDEAGFTVRDVFGDWNRGPVQAARPEMIFVATRD